MSCHSAATTPAQSARRCSPEKKPMSLTVPEVISRYFEFDAERDIDSIVALFADDATVIDEGEAVIIQPPTAGGYGEPSGA